MDPGRGQANLSLLLCPPVAGKAAPSFYNEEKNSEASSSFWGSKRSWGGGLGERKGSSIAALEGCSARGQLLRPLPQLQRAGALLAPGYGNPDVQEESLELFREIMLFSGGKK